jgi:hypothetical protein
MTGRASTYDFILSWVLQPCSLLVDWVQTGIAIDVNALIEQNFPCSVGVMWNRTWYLVA